MEAKIFKPETANPGENKSVRELKNLTSAVAMAAAAVTVSPLITSCATADSGREKQLEAQVDELNNELQNCMEKTPDLAMEGGVLSYGTFGVKWLHLNKETRLSASKRVEEVEQEFLIWPPLSRASEMSLEGDPNHLKAVQVGSKWEVIYKSKDIKDKEALVIDVRGNRYVIFIERK